MNDCRDITPPEGMNPGVSIYGINDSRHQCSKHEWLQRYKHLNKAVWRTAISPATEWQWSGLKIQGSNWWPSIAILTLSLHCWVMGSAHHLTKANNWPKFNKYLSKGSGDMEWTWNSRLELVTFNCDLDLESACLSYGFCTCLTKANIWPKFHENLSKGSGDMERTRKR